MNRRLKFWIKMHKFVDKHYEKAMHKHYTTVPPGVDIKRDHKGIVEDPPGTPPEQIEIIPLEEFYKLGGTIN